MKANRPVFKLLWLLSAAAIQLPAQQTDADRKLFEELKIKADDGDTDSLSQIGFCYQYGRLGQPTNSDEAVKWYSKAADRGFAPAQWSLGQMYSDGKGVRKSTAEAIKWYRKAADQGYDPALACLGSIYYFGKDMAGSDVPANYDEALKWGRKAAAQGDATGQWLLGDAFENGNGVRKDYTESIVWYRKSANQGHPVAQFSLGLLYAKGDGTAKDYVEAYKWWSLAGAVGDEYAAGTTAKAKGNLAILERKMTREQIAEAQSLARAFKPSKRLGSSTSASSEGIVGPKASGTGFFISTDGFVISNSHVIEGAGQVRLVTSTGLISVKVVKVDAANDLALLKAEGRFAALPVAASRGVKLGGTVATVGFPNIGLQGFAPKLAKGEIASLSGAGDDARYFQISVPVQPGNSGGALVDERGNVVGVVSAKLNASAALRSSGALPENVNYAVKSSYLLSFLESVPEVAAKLKEPSAKEKKFEDVVKEAEQAAVLVLVY